VAQEVKSNNLEYLTKVKQQGLKKLFPGMPRIAVGYASCGIAAGADRVLAAFEAEIKRRKLEVLLTKVGCIGYCTVEPIVNVTVPGLPLVL